MIKEIEMIIIIIVNSCRIYQFQSINFFVEKFHRILLLKMPIFLII